MSLEQKIEELTVQVATLTQVISNLSGELAPVEPKGTSGRVTQPEEVETSPEPAEEEKPKRKPRAKKITLAELKDLAKDKVTKTDRITVKNCIGKYGEKLTEVKESDYEALKADLEVL